MTTKDYDDSNWREEMQSYASGPELQLLIDGPKSLAQSWYMGALYNRWKKINGIKEEEPPNCQSSLKEFLEKTKDQGI